MNRGNFTPENGKRYKKIQKISKLASSSLLVLTVMSVLCCSAIYDKIGFSVNGEEDTGTAAPAPSPPKPSNDEIEAGADEIPDEYLGLYYENEYPIGLGIYDILFADEDNPKIPDGELKIVETDLSKNPIGGKIYLKNNTSYSLSADDFLSADGLSIPAAGEPVKDISNPKVLIYHTHGTEAYADEDRTSYAKKDLPRSNDITNNVVAVGKVLADTLNANGVPTIHCEIMHDEKSYNNSYTYSRNTVTEYLEKYPSIEYIFDIHRDALLNSTSVYKTLTYDESTPVAQLMLVVGTDTEGADHPNWRENLSFAVDTQYLLTKRLENIVRPICIKKSSYNQQYSDGGILIEVGTCVNTLAEAKASAVILGEVLAGHINAR